MNKDQQRIAVVTGGGNGIGRATAKLLAQTGDFVVVADVSALSGLRVVEEIRAAGGAAAFRLVDVADVPAVNSLAHSVQADFGLTDILVNAAGVWQTAASLEDTSIEAHDHVVNINYRGAYLSCRALAPQMLAQRKGCIINITSTAAVCASPMLADGPSKAALHMFTQNLAADLGPMNVRVNAVMPGHVLTEQVQMHIDAGHYDLHAMQTHCALGRLVLPQDVANAVGFLCSDAASAITGIALPVDCGFLPAVGYLGHPALGGRHPRWDGANPVA